MSSIPGPAAPSSSLSTSVAPPGWGGAAGLRPELPAGALSGAGTRDFAPPAGARPGIPSVAARSSVWWRIAAYTVDTSLAALTAFIGGLALRHAGVTGGTLTLGVVLAWLAGRTAATAGVAARRPGQTAGKWLAGLHVIRPGDGAIGAGTTFLRDVVYWCIYLVPLVIFIDAARADRPDRRSIRDHMAGTYVTGAPVGGQKAATWAALVVTTAALVPFLTLSVNTSSQALARTRAQFLTNCENGGGAPGFCHCAWSQLEARYSRDELLRLSGLEAHEAIVTAASACRSTQPTAPATSPA